MKKLEYYLLGIFLKIIRSSIELSGKAEDVIDVIMKYLRSGEMYIDIHTKKYPDGEIRGQIYPKY